MRQNIKKNKKITVYSFTDNYTTLNPLQGKTPLGADTDIGSDRHFFFAQMQKELEQTWQSLKQTAILVTHDVEEAVFLGDQVIVLSEVPTSIQSTIAINLARPRNRLAPEFIELCREIYQSLGIIY